MLKLSLHGGDVKGLDWKNYISHFFRIKNQGQFLHKPCQQRINYEFQLGYIRLEMKFWHNIVQYSISYGFIMLFSGGHDNTQQRITILTSLSKEFLTNFSGQLVASV